MHRMVYEHLRSPESTRRNLLGSPSPHVDFSRVYKTVFWKETTWLAYQDTGREDINMMVSHQRNKGSEHPNQQGSPLPRTALYNGLLPASNPHDSLLKSKNVQNLFFFPSDPQIVVLKICTLPKQYGCSPRAICLLHNSTAC